MAVSLLVGVFDDDEEEDQDEGDDNAAAVVGFGAQHSDGSNSKTSESRGREPTTQQQRQEPPVMKRGESNVWITGTFSDQEEEDEESNISQEEGRMTRMKPARCFPSCPVTKSWASSKPSATRPNPMDNSARAIASLESPPFGGGNSRFIGSPFTGMNILILITDGFSHVVLVATGTFDVVIDTSSWFTLTKKGSLVCLAPVYNIDNDDLPQSACGLVELDQLQQKWAGLNAKYMMTQTSFVDTATATAYDDDTDQYKQDLRYLVFLLERGDVKPKVAERVAWMMCRMRKG
ncbi:hypothetical protein ACHAXR_007995 [Thalassiosira sp. AJA248-18]